ncbi:MAG TPA: response regulator [Acidimicrobiales bacterium]|jgi:DNA-binding NarL/FixJ family response regulator|nr:response regulator [Acidimicrobiales bacterium]
MPDLLVVSDSANVREEVIAAIPDSSITVRELTRGAQVLPEVRRSKPDLIVLDSQIGAMGGMATCLDLHLEEGAGRLEHTPVLQLLDRRADVFLARRSSAEGFLVKPLDPMRVARAIRTLLAGGTYEDPAYRPVTVPLR